MVFSLRNVLKKSSQLLEHSSSTARVEPSRRRSQTPRHMFTQKIDLSLSRVSALLEDLGRPDKSYEIVHVAGTNGKGSVCAMIEAGVRHHGVSVGKFVSPFLREPRDAVTVDGNPPSVEAWAALEELVRESNERVCVRDPSLAGLTQFEAWTVAAFAHFRAASVAVAVVEVNLMSWRRMFVNILVGWRSCACAN